jgi:hypothetical protein
VLAASQDSLDIYDFRLMIDDFVRHCEEDVLPTKQSPRRRGDCFLRLRYAPLTYACGIVQAGRSQ